MLPLIKKLGAGNTSEFKDLIQLFKDVFNTAKGQMPDTDHLENLLLKDDFFVFAALLNNKVVGGITVYVLSQYYATIPVAYIYDLAVLTKHQRQGIGKLLISAALKYCASAGITEVFVQTGAEDVEALKFYHSTGATAEDVVHFNYLLKGQDDTNNH